MCLLKKMCFSAMFCFYYLVKIIFEAKLSVFVVNNAMVRKY